MTGRALATLVDLVIRHGVELMSIGNGTASRETDKLAVKSSNGGRTEAGTEGGKNRRERSGSFCYSASAFAAAGFRPWMSVCAVLCRLRADCRIRWPSWSKSTLNPSG